jgi:putative hemolysin
LTLKYLLNVDFVSLSLTGFPWSILLMVVVLVVLLILSAMVSGSEVAFFSLSPVTINDLEEDQSDYSQTILTLLSSPRELLATILIFNNFINVAIILLSSLVSSQLFTPNDVAIFSWVISGNMQVFVVNVVLITFVLLVFGEVVPKVYAAQNPIRLLQITASLLSGVNTVLVKIKVTPLLVKSTTFFNMDAKENAHNVTVDDLQHALDLTSKTTSEAEDTKILEGVVRFGNTDVKQIMTPRVQSVLIELGTPFSEIIKIIQETHYSRIPVYSESVDHVKGVLFAKDLLPYLNQENFEWETLLRPPFFVPENKKIDDLLKEFQSRKTHLAIVVDEYGGVSGLVSLENVIEEIVGDITDEFDDDDLFFSKISDDCFVFEGQTSLINMYRAIGVGGEEFESQKGEADSIAGFVLEIAGRIPLKGETIKFNNCSFTIESADRRRIKSIKVDVDRSADEN